MKENEKRIIDETLRNLTHRKCVTLPKNDIPPNAVSTEYLYTTTKGTEIYKVVLEDRKISLSYNELVSMLIRKVYATIDDEVALINNQLNSPELLPEYEEYQEIRRYIKQTAKEYMQSLEEPKKEVR